MDYQTAVKVSGGFGGGMFLGSVCGAVTGGIMAIGLKHGGVGMEPNIHSAMLVRQFADRFKAQYQSVNCPDLIGVDLSKVDLTNQQALAEFYKDANAKKTFVRCLGFVKDATTIVDDLLKDAPKGT